MGHFVLYILAFIAQWEREAIGERTREAMRHRKAQGGLSFPYQLCTQDPARRGGSKPTKRARSSPLGAANDRRPQMPPRAQRPVM